jgi:hypothetical protein
MTALVRPLSFASVSVLLALMGCGRAERFERPLAVGDAIALEHVVAWPLAGPPALAVHAPARDATAFFDLEAPVVAARATHAGNALLAVDEAGRATILRFDAEGAPSGRQDVDLGAAFSSIELTPDDRFAVFMHGPGGAGGAVVRNANELSVLDLDRPVGADNPRRRTLKSFGSGLRALVLPAPGSVADGARPLAFALSDRYLAIFDLSLPEADEVVVYFTLEGEARDVVPVSVLPVPGDDAHPPGALVRAQGSDDLYLLSFPAEAPSKAVPRPTLNVLPGSPALVDALPHRTPDGLRIFSLEGRTLAVVHPETGARRGVTLTFEGAALVPYAGVAGEPSALIWGRGAAQVAYVRLDALEASGSRAVRTLTMEGGLTDLLPIPGRAAAVGIESTRLVVLDFPGESATPFDLGGVLVGAESSVYWDEPAPVDGAGVVTDGASVFAVMRAAATGAHHLIRIEIGDDGVGGGAQAIPLTMGGAPLLVPGADRLVIDHGTTAGTISVLSTDAGAETRADVRRSLFLTEVLDR